MNYLKSFFLVIFRFFRDADMILLLLSVASAVYGSILINSITKNSATESGVVYVQIGAMVIGLFLFILFSYIDIDIIADKSMLLFVFSILFISTLLIWGEGEADVGRRAWIRFWNIGIQPAEVTKVPFIIIFAKIMVTFKERKTLNSIMSVLQIAIVFLIMFGFVLYISEDMGTALVYFGILIIMLFAAGLKLRWFILGAGAIAAASPLLRTYFINDKQWERIIAPFIPDIVDPNRNGVLWQPDLSIRAITTGGIFGQGLGQGQLTQSPRAFPAQHTDFVFSAAGEELGFIGCLVVIALLIAIVIRCVYVGIKSNNSLGLLVCMGVAGMVIVQTVMNIGMCLGLLPVIGITLPFFSYGGSSLVTSFAAMGIVSGIKMRPKPLRFRSM
jgi:rod shape determining protein RodA